jgi:ABC-type sugar transport system ATPase subunit
MTQTSDKVILEMRNISKSFGGVHALKNVSFTCERGRVHALLGENGAGKSTLIKILTGAYQADSGEIIYKGQQYDRMTTRQAMDRGISIIYQELNLIPNLTVAENIFLGREPRSFLNLINEKQLYRQANDLMNRLGVKLDLRKPVGDLAVASQQMVEIAKALSQKAELIVMDEPSAILAGHELKRLFEIIAALIEQGVTIIYISHRLEEVFQIASEVTVLKDGAVVGTRAIEDVTRSQLIQMMVGRSLDEVFPSRSNERGEPVLVAENIATDTILQDASLSLHAGEILGIAGMVGSGRTELARALFGADALRAGSITFKGQLLKLSSPVQAVKAGIALVPEDRKTQGLFPALPIRNNITLTILDKLTRGGIIQRRLETRTVEQARRELSINMASEGQHVQFLSGGNQQKVVLAKWLETSPDVIILDEPTRGIDVGAKFEIYQLMRQLTERGVAILMISSELPEILGMSDRILVMNTGRISGELSREEATEEKIIELATVGRSVGGTVEQTGS